MKTTTNAEELRNIGACTDDENCGLPRFLEVHGGYKEVKFSEGLKSNGWDDFWWFMGEVRPLLSKGQINDLHLLGCDYAEDAIHIYEAEFDDPQPRNAIQDSRASPDGVIDQRSLFATLDASKFVEPDAGSTAGYALKAARSTYLGSSARETARCAWLAYRPNLCNRREWQKQKLMDLLLRWEEEVR